MTPQTSTTKKKVTHLPNSDLPGVLIGLLLLRKTGSLDAGRCLQSQRGLHVRRDHALQGQILSCLMPICLTSLSECMRRVCLTELTVS